MLIKCSLFLDTVASSRNGSQNAICDAEAFIAAKSAFIMFCCTRSIIWSVIPVIFMTVVCNRCALLFASIENDDIPATIIKEINDIESICVKREDEQARRFQFPFLATGVATEELTEMTFSVSDAEW